MKKLSLHLDSLSVVSFATSSSGSSRRTVHAHAADSEPCTWTTCPTCTLPSCDGICDPGTEPTFWVDAVEECPA